MDVAVTANASLLRLLWMVVLTVGDVVVVFALLEEFSTNRSDRVLVFFGIVARPKYFLLLHAVSRPITVHVVIVVDETVADAVCWRYQSTTGGTDSGIGGFIFVNALAVMVVGRNHEHIVSAAGWTMR